MDKQSIPAQLRAVVRDLERTRTLYRPDGYAARSQAQDALGFQVQVLGDMDAETTPDERAERDYARQTADALSRRLERVNSQLLDDIRTSIRTGKYTGHALWRKLGNCLGPLRGANLDMHPGYDYVDEFVNRLLDVETGVTPQATRRLGEGMVSYQPTPARVLIKLLEWVRVKPGDVFYDLGSGLGHVAIMTHLLTGATVKGVEFEPTYCRYARACARNLGLQNVTFLNEDARQSDLDGTVFYLYTPFRGRLLQEMLDRLRAESQHRRIAICTYGPCTLAVSHADWVTTVRLHADREFGMGVFQAAPWPAAGTSARRTYPRVAA